MYYYLMGDSNLEGLSIGKTSGALLVEGEMHRESSEEVTLNVLAKNAGPLRGNDTATCTVRIVVRDANDPPYFSQQLYQGRVREDAAAGTTIVQVTATDPVSEDKFR